MAGGRIPVPLSWVVFILRFISSFNRNSSHIRTWCLASSPPRRVYDEDPGSISILIPIRKRDLFQEKCPFLFPTNPCVCQGKLFIFRGVFFYPRISNKSRVVPFFPLCHRLENEEHKKSFFSLGQAQLWSSFPGRLARGKKERNRKMWNIMADYKVKLIPAQFLRRPSVQEANKIAGKVGLASQKSY